MSNSFCQHEQNILKLVKKFKGKHSEDKIREVYEKIKHEVEISSKVKNFVPVVILKITRTILLEKIT